MSTATPQPALPKHPLGKTFIVSMGFLALFALVQVIGTLAYYAKNVKKGLVDLSNRPQAEADTSPSLAQKSQVLAPAPVAPEPSLADVQKVHKLLVDGTHYFQVGEFDAALKSLDEADTLQPGDPMVLLAKAAVYEKTEQIDEAVKALEAALRSPGLPAQYRAPAERKLDQLSRLLADNPPPSGSKAPEAPANPGEDVREVGIQPGSTLGIVDVQLRDVKPGVKGLRVAVKSLPNANINVKDVKVVVYFYEQNEDGDVTLTDSKPISQWLSPPIDWASDEPELLEMQYSPPAAGEAGGGRKYYGYVVGIYYNGELQDLRADPGKLARDFALPLYLKQDSE